MAFTESAKWATNTMIDKACKWLDSFTGLTKVNIEYFRKAMEEE